MSSRRARLLRGGARSLVLPGVLVAPLTLARSQGAGIESAADGAGVVALFGADVPRFQAPSGRLLIQGQRTNLTTLGRTFGALGTGITVTATTGADGGATTGHRWDEGTANSQHQAQLGTIAVTAGLPYAQLHAVRPGTATTCQITFPSATFGVNAFANFDLTGAGALGTAGTAITRQTIRRLGDWYLVEAVAPATITGSAAGALMMTTTPSSVRAPTYTGTSRTLDVWGATFCEATFACGFILPPVGAPASVARGPDLLTALLAALGVPASGACTILLRGMIPQSAPAGVHQTLLQIDDGSDANCFVLRNAAGGNTIVANRVLASVAGAGATAGSMTPGTEFRAGVSIDGAGRIAASLNGAAAVAQAGGPTSGLTRLLVGSAGAAGGLEALFGEIAPLRVIPAAMSDAALAAAVGAL